MRPLIEAAEAFPAFEEAALSAKREILFGMRLFEADLPLQSDRAKAAGFATWAELLAARAADGVDVRILLTDFEPVMAADLHQAAWRSMEGFIAAADAAGAADNFSVIASLHPGEIGRIARLAFWPVVRGRLANVPRAAGDEIDLDRSPGLWAYLRRRGRSATVKLAPKIRLWPATHHQKMATFDGATAIVGGIDLARRMYDDRDHDRPAEQTWHDVSLLVDGPVAGAARRHLRDLWNVSVPGFNARVTRMGAPDRRFLRPAAPLLEAGPAPAAGSGFLRTRSRRARSPFALGPRPDVVEIETALVAGIARAERLIYLETQFLRSPVVAGALAAAARARPALTLILLLPAAPDDIAFKGNRDAAARHGEWLQARALGEVQSAFGGRCGVFSLAKPEAGSETPDHARAELADAPIVYVHAKVSIFDGAVAIVGSANLNGRSLKWDTETAVVWRDAAAVAEFQQRLWDVHFAVDAPRAAGNALDAWRSRAERNQAAEPNERQGFVLPYDMAACRAYARRRWWIPTDML